MSEPAAVMKTMESNASIRHLSRRADARILGMVDPFLARVFTGRVITARADGGSVAA
jgi:hypothetical protein